MEKDLVKLDNEQNDDDFDKLFQDYLNEELSSKDSDTNDEDTTEGDANDDDEDDISLRFRGERHYMPELFKVGIEVQPDLFDTPYVNGDIVVAILGKEGTCLTEERFKLNILAEGYYPMATTQFYHEAELQFPDMLTITMMSREVWLPGNYMLYVRDTTDDSLLQIPFTLNDELEASVGDPSPCLPCSPEDILTSVIDGYCYDWDRLAQRPGMAQIRNYVVTQKQFEVYNEFRQEMHGYKLCGKGHLLIATRNNDLMPHHLRSLCTLVADDYTFRPIDCSTLFDAARNNPYEQLFEELSVSGKHVFCLTNPGALLSTGGKVIVKRIIDKIRSDEDSYLLWLCGYKSDVEAVLNMFPSMGAFFPSDHRLEQEPPKDFEQVHAFFDALNDERLSCSIEAMDGFAKAILKGCRQGVLSSWSLSDIRQFVVEQVKPRYLARCYREISEEHLPCIELDDLCLDQLTSTESTYEQCLKDLDEMIGLDEVKEGIRKMANNTKFFAERRRRGLTTSQEATFHCIFTGNPGTGKTTVAKKLGRIYRSLGLLSRGNVIAVDRTRLVGRYIGETEENMKTILDEARGNVLFIDEAYTLYDGASDRKDFGARVIDSLLTVLSQPDPDMLVIFAGYLKEMDAMLNTNPGLLGRFPYKYQFKDYNAGQLFDIAIRQLKHDDYLLSPEAEAKLREAIAKAYAQRDDNFSNARWVEQFVSHGIIPAMASRISQTGCDDYQTVEVADIRQAYDKFNPKATALKTRQKVGFNA
ncbi:MAG: AAA family ATPase [Prevotella sp.]|nr:AAA family ATPase [Prevotella sp.]